MMTLAIFEPQEEGIDPRLGRLEPLARAKISGDDASHDWAHVERVVHNCLRIGRDMPVRFGILLPAALLHDMVNVPKNHPDRMAASRRSAEAAVSILTECEYADREIADIQTVIAEHGYSLNASPSSLESAVLQDADRLDALGAIGVFRAVTCGAHMGSRYYHPGEPFAEMRALDDRQYTLDHFYTKLLHLAQRFHTEEGRNEARRRTEFMQVFIDQFRNEIDGNYR